MSHNVGVTIGGVEVAAGQKRAIRLPVTTDLNGHEVSVWVHVVAGARPGPTVTLTAAQHGDEWQTSLFVREAIMMLDPADLAGNFIGLPVCSQPALGGLTRLTQMDSDGPDLNRVFPGLHTWVPEQIAKVIDREVLSATNFLLDCHFGIWGTGIGIVAYGTDFPEPKVVEQCRALALAYGYPVINKGRMFGGFPGPRSLLGYAAGRRGIPGIAIEVGVAGMAKSIEDHYLAMNRRGLTNVLRLVGCLTGAVEYADRYLLFEKSHRLSATKGGYLLPVHDPDQPGRRVVKGEKLGDIISPYTFETLETIVATGTGPLTLAPRNYPVRPGDWAFGIALEDDPNAEWVTP